MIRIDSILPLVLLACAPAALGQQIPVVRVEAQPLAANVSRLVKALDFLGHPLPESLKSQIAGAAQARDAERLQTILDRHVLLVAHINPEERVKLSRGPAPAMLQQGGFIPFLIKIENHSTATKRLRVFSHQAGPVYAGVSEFSLKRQEQTELGLGQSETVRTNRFIDVELFQSAPMTERLSGLEVEYAIALLYTSESGKREVTLGLDIGQGTQDLGFRGELPILFQAKPAIDLRLSIKDSDGQPTIAKLEFRDTAGHVHPPQAKRLAPDLFFQPYVYRFDGETVKLPPGKFTVRYSRGPEYQVLTKQLQVTSAEQQTLSLQLRRWINTADYGFFSGDHHIHAAGCAHYTSPTQGFSPADMFRQVKGEGLNIGCILTWGPCFDHQRTYFGPTADNVSDRETLIKYDLEISGFGSQALGHVCLLNLSDQTYPGSAGTSTKGWPTWTTPVMRWAKEQGGYAGYAHSASGLHIDPASAAQRMLSAYDQNGDEMLSADEAANALLTETFSQIDNDQNRQLTLVELTRSHDRVADQLPNLAIPEMNGVGAMEICVSTVAGVCDFISAMDTARIQEWNTWYHILNCGFPLKVSGETDFPCMSSRRVGQGRVYVQLDRDMPLDYAKWCQGLASGRSYVSDGFAHALNFAVDGTSPGRGAVKRDKPGSVTVTATVAFAPATPKTVAQGIVEPPSGQRKSGDTVHLHVGRSDQFQAGGKRTVEIVVNGQPVRRFTTPADGQPHQLSFEVPLTKSSWIALRQFPQLHTNPVDVIIGDKPIRASGESARWCVEMTKLLWKNRQRRISPAERPVARIAFETAIDRFGQIEQESE